MISKTKLDSITEDMTGEDTVDYEYLQTIVRMSNDELQGRVRHLDFTDFLELQTAIDMYDEDKIIQLLDFGHHVEEGQGDNPYSSARPGAMGGTGMGSSSAMSGYQGSANRDLDRAMSGLPDLKKTVKKTNEPIKPHQSSTSDMKDEITNFKPGDDVKIATDDEQYDAIIKSHEPEGTIVIIDGEEFLFPKGHKDATVIKTEESLDIDRIQELAGIEETASGGASGAGGIASMATPVGGMKKRSDPSIYTPKRIKKKIKKTK